MKGKEIAQRLNLPYTTVNWRIHTLQQRAKKENDTILLKAVTPPFTEETVRIVADCVTRIRESNGYTPGPGDEVVKPEHHVSTVLGEFLHQYKREANIANTKTNQMLYGKLFNKFRSRYGLITISWKIDIPDYDTFKEYVVSEEGFEALKKSRQQDLSTGRLPAVPKIANLRAALSYQRRNHPDIFDNEEWQYWRKYFVQEYSNSDKIYARDRAVLEYALANKWISHDDYWRIRDRQEEVVLEKEEQRCNTVSNARIVAIKD